jgi:hypothetical protein
VQKNSPGFEVFAESATAAAARRMQRAFTEMLCSAGCRRVSERKFDGGTVNPDLSKKEWIAIHIARCDEKWNDR